MPLALVTGGSAGLGRVLTHALADNGWTVITDGRDAGRLAAAADRPGIVAIPGDVTDTGHQDALGAAVRARGPLDLLVHNASTLGPDPARSGHEGWLPRLADATADDLGYVWERNVAAPLALTAALLPDLRTARGVLVAISSDAAAEHYEGWGLYGASKAALDHLVLTVAAENAEVTAYAVDPGDMRTGMHADAFPGEDISDRPLPESVVPHLLALLAERPASGRYRAREISLGATVVAALRQVV